MRQFSERILNYVAQFQEYILDSVQNTVAPCRPIWNVFQGMRQLLCRHLIDPLVIFAFTATPLTQSSQTFNIHSGLLIPLFLRFKFNKITSLHFNLVMYKL